MINFDAVDFSERRSEEVMFLLTLRILRIILSKLYQIPKEIMRFPLKRV